MKKILLAVTMLLMVSVGFAEDKLPSLNQFTAELKKVVLTYYPEAEFTVTDNTINFEYETRIFKIHYPLKTGEWQDARDVKGPKRKGILADIRLLPDKYVGQAVVPQVINDRYFYCLLLAPSSAKYNCHLHTCLYYPEGTSKEFISAFAKIIDNFESYLEDKQTQPFQLTIKSDKQVYEVGEEIKIAFVIKNNSDRDVSLEGFSKEPNSYNSEVFNCDIFGKKDGATLALKKPEMHIPMTISGPRRWIIHKGDTLEIDQLFNKWKTVDAKSVSEQPGVYELQGKCINISMDTHAKVSLFSNNTITIEVAEKKLTTQSKNLDKEMVESWGRQKDFFIEKNFEIIDWEKAKKILLSEKIRGGKQYHTGWLTIYTFDDKYLTKQPKMDALWQFMEENSLGLEGFGTE